MTPEQASAYLQANQDVWQAFLADPQGMTPAQFAAAHWAKYGQAEGRPGGPAQAPQAPQPQQPARLTEEQLVEALRLQRADPTSLTGEQKLALGQAKQWVAGMDDAALQAMAAKYSRTPDLGSIAAQRAQAADAEWMKQIEGQGWYADFMAHAGAPGGNPWSYDPRLKQWANSKNTLIDRYGTADAREYAQRMGIAMPAGSRWRADPTMSQRDTSAPPALTPELQASADRSQQIQSQRAETGLIDGARSRAAGVAALGRGLVQPTAPPSPPEPPADPLKAGLTQRRGIR